MFFWTFFEKHFLHFSKNFKIMILRYFVFRPEKSRFFGKDDLKKLKTSQKMKNVVSFVTSSTPRSSKSASVAATDVRICVFSLQQVLRIKKCESCPFFFKKNFEIFSKVGKKLLPATFELVNLIKHSHSR